MEAGAAGIVVSNHGGPGTGSVSGNGGSAAGDRESGGRKDEDLRRRRNPFRYRCIQGTGTRSGRSDHCKTIVTAVYGGGSEGVQVYTNKIKSELEDTMAMCGTFSLDEIGTEQIWRG